MREQLPLDTLERNSEAQIMAEIVAEGFYQPLYELLPLHKLSYKCFTQEGYYAGAESPL